MAMLGFLASVLVLRYILKKKKQNYEMALEILLVVLPTAIIGARIWYVLFNEGVDFFDFRGGGLAWHGGVIAAVLGLLLYCKLKKINFFKVGDACAVVVPLGHAFGRVGNIINVEIYGNKTSIQLFPFAQEVNGEYYTNIAFFEMLLLLLLFMGLFLWYKKNKKIGLVMPFYLLGYGLIRLILEPFRNSEFILQAGDLQVSIVMSILLLLIGAGILGFMLYRYNYLKVPQLASNTYELSEHVEIKKLVKEDIYNDDGEIIDAIVNSEEYKKYEKKNIETSLDTQYQNLNGETILDLEGTSYEDSDLTVENEIMTLNTNEAIFESEDAFANDITKELNNIVSDKNFKNKDKNK